MTEGMVSIVVPVYNGAKYIKDSVGSVLASTYGNFEVVCVDDFSTDGSAELVQSMSACDARVRLVRRDAKGGNAGAGIAYGLPHCNGEFFFYMSQDDMISPDCLEKCVKRARETGADIVAVDTVFYSGDRSDGKRLLPPGGDHGVVLDPVEAMRLVSQYKIPGFSLRKMSLVRKVGCESHFYDSCDKSIWLQFYHANKVAFCDGVMYYRQDNPSAITKGVHRHTYDHVATVDEFLAFLQAEGLPYRIIREVAIHYDKTKRWLRSQLPALGGRDAEEAARILERSDRFQIGLALRRLDFSLIDRIVRPKHRLKRLVYRVRRWLARFVFHSSRMLEAAENGLENLSGGLSKEERLAKTLRNARSLPCSVGRCTYAGVNVSVGSVD